MKQKIFFTVLLFANWTVFSQFFNFYGLKLGYGNLLAHHDFVRYYSQKSPLELNFVMGWASTTNKKWQQNWNYPDVGFGLYYSTSVNPSILGNPIAAYVHSDFVLAQNRLFKLSWEVNIGAAYLTKKFDYKANHTNLLIGSHINIFASLNLKANMKIINNEFFTGFSMTHYSNGGTYHPNYGINILSAIVGWKYFSMRQLRPNFVCQREKFANDLIFIASSFVRSTEHSLSNPAKQIFTFTADYGFYNNGKWRLGAGVDYLYDGAGVYYFDDTIQNSDKLKLLSSAGIHLSAEAIFGKVRFTFQQLLFLYQKYEFYRFCQRYGFRYFIKSKYILNLTMTSYLASAMFVEFGVGYRLTFKR